MPDNNESSNSAGTSQGGSRNPVGIDDERGKTTPPVEPAVVRFSVNLARDSADILRSVAAKKQITVTDAFRRAISIMEAIDEELELGKDIQSVDRAGERTRIIFR